MPCELPRKPNQKNDTQMCMPTARIGLPAFDPLVQPSIDFFCNTYVCVCVLTAAVGLQKLLNVQNLHLTSSLGYSEKHMLVFTAAFGWPALS